jgi:hypothetical protein
VWRHRCGWVKHWGGFIFALVGALVSSGLGDKEKGSYAAAWPSKRW